MCWYEAFDEIKWFSSTDVSTPVLGLRCEKVTGGPAGFSPTGWARLVKALTLIDRWPW